MEQFLRDFFNDNSVCVGLCDLKRKIEDAKFNFVPQTQLQQPMTQQVQQTLQPKAKKQTLAQKFAAEQQAYAAKQAYLEEQRKRYVEMQRQVEQMEQQVAQQQFNQQKVVQQKKVYSEAKPLYTKLNTSVAAQQAPQSRVIVHGNMKKVISAAVPARY